MYRVRFTLIFILLTPFYSFGQSGQTISKEDSTKLFGFLNRFVKAINEQETEELKKISMDRIDCISCIADRIPPPESYLVPVDTFINQTYRTFEKSRLWDCVRNEQPMINLLRLTGKDFEQKELKKKQGINIYELFYLTTKPNEIQFGHEGQQTGLQFIKLDNAFKFYGLTTVP
jgi:hypothetical protein